MNTTQASAANPIHDRAHRYQQAEQIYWDHYGLAPKEHQVKAGSPSTHLRVQEVGSGTPILFVHGRALDARMWEGQIPVLERAGYEVIAPNLPDREPDPDLTKLFLHQERHLTADAAGIRQRQLECQRPSILVEHSIAIGIIPSGGGQKSAWPGSWRLATDWAEYAEWVKETRGPDALEPIREAYKRARSAVRPYVKPTD